MARTIQLYGPQTGALMDFLRAVDGLTPTQWRGVATQYSRAGRAERERAEIMIIDRLLTNRARLAQEWSAQERVKALVDRLREAEPEDDQFRADRLDILGIHIALGYAVAAILAADLIDGKTFSTLYDPFRSLIPLELHSQVA